MSHVTASAPGKCILFGEHAVVYGQPAVAVAIDQRIKVKIQPSQTGLWLLDGGDLNFKRNPHIAGLIDRLWADDETLQPLSFYIEGNIPRASGLGSSAALSTAIAAALRMAKGRWLNANGDGSDNNQWSEGYSSSIKETNPYTGSGYRENREEQYAKKAFHLIGPQAVDIDECALLAHSVEADAQNGRASPMDSSTCSHGGIVVISDKREANIDWQYTRKMTTPEGVRTWEIHTMAPPKDDVYLVIGNTGIHAPTSRQVANVAKMLEKNPKRFREIETIGRIARRGIAALIQGDYEAVGRTMTENHLMLQSIGVSSPELDNLIKAAASTSLGAKLTGAGGGGCMIALTRDPKLTSDAIELAGGRTLITKLGAVGVSIDDYEGIPFCQ